MNTRDERVMSLEAKLLKASLMELRQVARVLGVHCPAKGRKERLVSDMLALAKGEAAPIKLSNRGAPPKSSAYDKDLYAEIVECRRLFLEPSATNSHIVVNDCLDIGLGSPQTGILFQRNGEYFLKIYANVLTEISVMERFVNILRLRVGDCLKVMCGLKADGAFEVTEILAVNGMSAGDAEKRGNFATYSRALPQKLLKVGSAESVAARQIDFFTPLLLGQRILAFAADVATKSRLTDELICGISQNNPNIKVAAAFICSRPEERIGLCNRMSDAQLFFADFDKSKEEQLFNITLAAEYAKRQVELGKDTVLILDGLFNIVKRYNAVDVEAAEQLKKVFAYAGNMSSGATLTVVAISDADNSSDIDAALINEFARYSNTVVSARLCGDLCLDVNASYTETESRLMSGARLKAVEAMRKMPCESVCGIFGRTTDEALIEEQFRD